MVVDIARSLKYDINLIYEHARNNVTYLPMFGLKKGSRGVILDGAGTDFDQAQFMVDALREADAVGGTTYAPSYVLGTITLTATEFSNWMGVSTATAATKLLANGGIPATVSGTGTNFTVTMLHVWVRATVSGTAYLFDPSYKPSVWHAGMAWQGASSYTLADLLANGVTGNATSVSGFGTTAFRQRLSTYRSQVENYIATNAAGMKADDVVGYYDITPLVPADLTRTSLSYVSSSNATWNGEIPDVYRTTMTVSLNGQNYGTYFADKSGNGVFAFPYSYSSTTGTFTASPQTNATGRPFYGPLVAGNPFNECEQFVGYKTGSATATASVSINHPYAGSSGAYGDRTISRQINLKPCTAGTFYVSNDWGTVSGEVGRRLTPIMATISPSYTSFPFANTIASIARQYSQFIDLESRMFGNAYQIHDLVGIHTIEDADTSLTTTTTNYTPNNFVTFDLEASVSTFSKAGTTSDDTSAGFLAGLGLSYAEAAAPRQDADSVYDMAGLTLLTQQDTRANPVGTYSTYLATPSTWASVSSSLSGYSAGETGAIQGYLGEGYSVLVPQKAGLRQPPITVQITGSSFSRTSALWEGITLSGGTTYDGGELKRTPFLAWHNSAGAGTPPDRLAIAMYDPRRGGILKAGIGVAVDPSSSVVRTPEQPKPESKDIIRSALNIDGRTGTVSYSPAPDLVDGTGDFPYSLSFQRRYDQNDVTNYGIGTGWKHNWAQFATLSNSGPAALGAESAAAIGPALVGLTAIKDLVLGQDAKNLYAALQALAWVTDQAQNNSINLTLGLDGEKTFYAQSGGTFRSASADGESLSYQGTVNVGIMNRWQYYNTSIAYTDRNKSIRNYNIPNVNPAFDISSPGISAMYSKKTAYLTNWTFANGVKITTTYNNPVATPSVVSLNSAVNSLGKSVTMTLLDYGANFAYYCVSTGGPVSRNPGRPGKMTFATSGGNTASFVTGIQAFQMLPIGYIYDNTQGVVVSADTGNALMCPQNSNTPPITTISVPLVPMTGSIASDLSTWAYGTANIPVPFLIPAGGGGYYTTISVLGSIRSPGDASNTMQIGFGADGRGQTLTSINGYVWQHYTSPWRSEIRSPLQVSANGSGSVTYYDRFARPVKAIDALGRAATTAYDQASRPTSVAKPEGDATTTSYDVRSNPVQQVGIGKPGSGLSNLVSTAAYLEGPTVAACTNQATCNRPSYVIDAKGNRTNYTWDPTHGQMLTETSGLNAAGTCALASGACPVKTFGYTAFTGADGATFYLLTSKVEKIDATNTTTTTYEYDSANKYALKSSVVDSGGLALRTCFKFDSTGNLIFKTDPKAALAVCP